MATYLADRVIVFDGVPSIKTLANTPTSLLLGMNSFLKSLEITFRRDSENFRPRINKKNSVKVSKFCIESCCISLCRIWNKSSLETTFS